MQTTINIEGMTCGGCVKNAETILTDLEGVQQVVVNLVQGDAVIDFDESKVNVEQMIEVIEDAGFDATAAH